MMKKNLIKIIYFTVLIPLLLLSCDKGEERFYYEGKNVPLIVKGYNASQEELIMLVDTFKYAVRANSLFENGNAYTFLEGKEKVKFQLLEKSSEKVLFEKEISKSDKEFRYSLFNLNGKVEIFEPPAADPKTNKIGLFIVNNKSDVPADIYLTDYWDKKILTLGENVPVNKWVFFEATLKLDKPKEVVNFFTLHGKNEGYFGPDLYRNFIDGSFLFPTDGSTGAVRCFIIVEMDGDRGRIGKPIIL